MGKGQSDRLTAQQVEGQGPVTIFHPDAVVHDQEVGSTARRTVLELQKEFPRLTFRFRKALSKREINQALKCIDPQLGQTLFVPSAQIKPDGGLIEVLDDHGCWRVVLVSEAKHQGKDIENIRNGVLVGKKKDQDTMVAGNAIERAYKNVNEIANFMLDERHFPYVLFLEGSNFLTQNVTIARPDGRQVTLRYNDGSLNRLDRLTAANYGMPINTNLCRNKFVSCGSGNLMLQAASIYTKGSGGHWDEDEMVAVMLDVARTSLRVLAEDIFDQIG